MRYPEKCRTGCPDWIFGVYRPAESRCFFASFGYPFSPSRKADLHSRRRVSAGEAAGTKFSCFFVCPFPCPFPPERQFFPLRRRASAGKAAGTKSSCFFVCFLPALFSPESQPFRSRASAGKINGYQIQLFFRVPFSTPERPPPSAGRTLFPRSVRLTTPLPRAEPAPGSFAAARENGNLPSRQALGEGLSSSRALPKGFPRYFPPSIQTAPHCSPSRQGPPFPARAAEHPSHPVLHKMRRRRHPPFGCLIRPAAPVSRPTVWVVGQWQGTAGNSCNRAQVFTKEQAHFAKLWLPQFP